MKRFLAIAAAFAFVGSAMAADLSLTVRSDGTPGNINAPAGGTVPYEIIGVLSDDFNEGLALFGFDLVYDGGDMDQASAPAGDITDGFVTPNGINNPAGFGGTVIGGDLIQVGGGQNTIKNDIGNAPFPIGLVITGVGQTSVTLATGFVTVPEGATEGSVYTISVANVFANVIKEGETGEPPQNFWKTEAAGVGALTDLTITVSDACNLVSATDPDSCSIDAGQPTYPDGTGTFGATAITLNFSCATAANDVTGADIAITGGDAPGIDSDSQDGDDLNLLLTGPIDAGVWTCFEYTTLTQSECVGFLPGDVDGSGSSDGDDVHAMVAALDGGTAQDIDRIGGPGPEDLLRVIDLLNGGDEFDVWYGQSIGSCPS
ncbi:MAG: hypothetical protein ACYTHJ_19115 [Planctomycetota bacterium]|jgi:hypothetical protein